jgi:hypothetical protein
LDLAATLFSTGWASGVNAYATVAMLSLLGRAGVGEVPDGIQSDPVLFAAIGMFIVEFVTDKVPVVDSLWDTIHTVIRPVIGTALGFEFAGQEGVSGIEEALGAGGTGATALASHGVKAMLRLGINTSPEPASNIFVSFAEDGVVGVVAFLALENPELAAAIAATFLIVGTTLIVLLWKRVRRGLQRRRELREARRRGG